MAGDSAPGGGAAAAGSATGSARSGDADHDDLDEARPDGRRAIESGRAQSRSRVSSAPWKKTSAVVQTAAAPP